MDNRNKIIATYEYYLSILELMLADMSNVTFEDALDVLDELETEVEKLKK